MHRLPLICTFVFSALILLLTARILADLSVYQLGKSMGGRHGIATTTASNVQSAQQLALSSLAPIVEKGLFGPATRGAFTPLVQQTAVQTGPTVSQTDLLLLGTVTGSPSAGFALIRKTSGNEERVFRLGERVYDLGILAAVRKDAADIRSAAQLVTLRTPDAPVEANRPAPAAAVTTTGVSGGIIAPQAGGSGIIDQRALNAALDNIGQAMTDARLLPSIKDGKVEGFRLSEVKPQGVFGALGLKNGDVLAKINDFPIDSPEKAVQSFMTLKGQNRIRLDLVRDGSPTTLSYDIR